MSSTASDRLTEIPAEPRFRIGQDVRLKSGGPGMIVNQCTQAAGGGFVIDTIWFGTERAEERGTYREDELEAGLPRNNGDS